MNVSEFIKSITPGAIETYKQTGVLPSVTIAQAILESSDKNGVPGNSSLARLYNNIFGIKGIGTAGAVNLSTTENIGGKLQNTKANFRVYNNLNESIIDHADVLSADRYSKVRTASNYKSATYELQKAGYATDSNYSGKLNSIIAQNKLYQIDSTVQSGGVEEFNILSNFNPFNITAGIGGGIATIAGVILLIIGLIYLLSE